MRPQKERYSIPKRLGIHMMALPLVVFWVVLLAGRRELGWKGTLGFVIAWLVLAIGFSACGSNKYFFTAAESILDVLLLTAIYMGFTRVR